MMALVTHCSSQTQEYISDRLRGLAFLTGPERFLGHTFLAELNRLRDHIITTGLERLTCLASSTIFKVIGSHALFWGHDEYRNYIISQGLTDKETVSSLLGLTISEATPSFMNITD